MKHSAAAGRSRIRDAQRNKTTQECAWCYERLPAEQLSNISGRRLCPGCTSLYHGGDEDEQDADLE